jgi:hypothetical protein
METDTCKNCRQPFKHGELVTGQSWSGDGGVHITCPEPEATQASVADYLPIDDKTGVYVLDTAANPYLAMWERTNGGR